MADVAIATDHSATPAQTFYYGNRTLAWTTEDIGYQIYIDANADLVYKKTTDGGANWGSAVAVRTGTVVAACLWFDKWTSGNTGTTIHMWYIDTGTDDHNE